VSPLVPGRAAAAIARARRLAPPPGRRDRRALDHGRAAGATPAPAARPPPMAPPRSPSSTSRLPPGRGAAAGPRQRDQVDASQRQQRPDRRRPPRPAAARPLRRARRADLYLRWLVAWGVRPGVGASRSGSSFGRDRQAAACWAAAASCWRSGELGAAVASCWRRPGTPPRRRRHRHRGVRGCAGPGGTTRADGNRCGLPPVRAAARRRAPGRLPSAITAVTAVMTNAPPGSWSSRKATVKTNENASAPFGDRTQSIGDERGPRSAAAWYLGGGGDIEIAEGTAVAADCGPRWRRAAAASLQKELLRRAVERAPGAAGLRRQSTALTGRLRAGVAAAAVRKFAVATLSRHRAGPRPPRRARRCCSRFATAKSSPWPGQKPLTRPAGNGAKNSAMRRR
jgi:hypothetical protein